MTIPSTRNYLHEGTAPGAYQVNATNGFESAAPDKQRLVWATIKSTLTLTAGDLVQTSGGFIRSADASTKPGEMAGVVQNTVTGTTGTSTQVCIDASLLDGVPFKVTLSDATVTAAYQGTYAVLGSTNAKCLKSGAGVDSALFFIEQVLSTTNKVVRVVVNRGQNS